MHPKSYNYITNLKKEVFTTIHERILNERKRLDEQINSIQSQLSTYPEGKIFCTRNGNRYKWYQSDGKNQTYIPKKNRHLAEQLAAKKYLSLQLEELLQEKRAIDFYLRHHASFPGKSTQMLTDMPEYQELLAPYFKPLSQELSQWMNAPYDHNTKHPEHLVHGTISGNVVRSKSETLIDMILYINKIPFRYECALQLGESVVYPDFTIRHPRTGETYYWEHFGKMDDPYYCKTACTKLQNYTMYGIIPSIQLITTYETMDNPLGTETIEKIVSEYFL